MTVLDPPIARAARAARAYTGLSQELLGNAAGVATRTIFKLEDDGKITRESLERVIAAFERLGVVMHYDARGEVDGMAFRAAATAARPLNR